MGMIYKIKHLLVGRWGMLLMDPLLPLDAAEGWRGKSSKIVLEDLCLKAWRTFCNGGGLPKMLSGIKRCPGKDMVLMNAGPGALGISKGSFDPAKRNQHITFNQVRAGQKPGPQEGQLM